MISNRAAEGIVHWVSLKRVTVSGMQPFPELLRRSELLRAQTQTALADFLSADIELGFTFLNVATATTDPDHVVGLIDKARRVVASVRHLAERVEDGSVQTAIRDRVGALEAAVNAFSS